MAVHRPVFKKSVKYAVVALKRAIKSKPNFYPRTYKKNLGVTDHEKVKTDIIDLNLLKSA